jgi:hypothetical protein
MNTKMACMIGLLTVSGCATPSTGIMPFGRDTYTLATTSQFGTADAKRDALQQANVFCAGKGLAMMPVNEVSNASINAFTVTIAPAARTTTFDFTFRCLASSDPDFVRTEFDRPDVVIQNQK